MRTNPDIKSSNTVRRFIYDVQSPWSWAEFVLWLTILHLLMIARGHVLAAFDMSDQSMFGFKSDTIYFVSAAGFGGFLSTALVVSLRARQENSRERNDRDSL